jgi:predicted metalloprotease with PDZ domain
MHDQPLIDYRIDLNPASRELAVALTVDGLDVSSPLDLAVPTWVPGAYGFMRYGRDVFEVSAKDEHGSPRAVERSGWTGFRVAAGARRLVVNFRSKLSDPAWGELAGYIEGSWAVILATRCLFVPARQEEKVRVRYRLPPGFALHHPAGATAGVEEHTWEYPSFRAWLDTPVVAFAANVTHLTRSVGGTPFHYVFLGKTLGFESSVNPFLDEVERVALACKELFGEFPFEHYTFVFAFDPRFQWGLEHANATMIGLSENVFVDEEDRLSAFRVSAHELIHAWNVCRLRPRGLGTSPGELDLVGGSYTEGLWVSEGFTRYYEFLTCARAGLMDVRRFFSNMVRYHRALSERPAHPRTSAVDSSLATFLNHHRYPGAVATMVDYYDHGMLVAFDLDCALRAAGHDLDTEFRAFYEAFVARPLGFSTEEAIGFLRERTPAVEAQLRREVQGAPARLSTLEHLSAMGFELGFSEEPVLGLVLRENRGPDVVDVIEGTPAAEAGIAPGDIITKIEGFVFSAKGLSWTTRTTSRPFELEVRRGHEHRTVTLEPRTLRRLTTLTWRGTESQRRALETWLGTFDLSDGSKIPLTHYDNFHGTEGVS